MRRIVRGWYWLRSFFRPSWELEDYPVNVRDQGEPDDAERPPHTRELVMPRFVATIDGMFIAGTGDTAAAARDELAKRFAEFRAAQPLPRPGTQQPIVFASSARIDAHGDLRDEFLERVLNMGANIFVSDESSLSDFPEDPAEYNRRVILLYGIDVDHLENAKLVTILDAIAKR